jgi:hypothetical protein
MSLITQRAIRSERDRNRAFRRPIPVLGNDPRYVVWKNCSRRIVREARKRDVRYWADIVAKVENRTTPKISRKQISRQLHRCNALHRRCEGPWSFSWETMRTLTSPYTKRISSPRKFRSSPQKDFCNNIGTKQTCRARRVTFAIERNNEHRMAVPRCPPLTRS